MARAVGRALATLAAVLVLTVPSTGASAGDGTTVPDWLDRTAREMDPGKGQGGTLVVTVGQPLALGEGDVRAGMEGVVEAMNKPDVRLVVVQESPDSGPGGALLLLLADSAVVPRDAGISTLSQKLLQSAKELHLCDRTRNRLCQALAQRNGKHVRAGDPGPESDPRMAQDEQAALGKARPPEGTEPHRLVLPPPDGTDGDGTGPPVTLLLTLLTAGAALIALAVLRTRYRPASAAGGARDAALPASTGPAIDSSSPARTAASAPAPPRCPPQRSWPADRAEPAPGGSRAVPAGPVRPATVRTGLHPQGYVELDGWLYRASWAEPYLAPPAPGETVDVTDCRAGALLAYAPGDCRS
ncbi:hypothetical protein JK361_18815 [Streptomyces sp. 5-8]|uniref:Uncharacterized protein n=1 Tax=Streptomyces musisoli TaxID=2802280 RepID=A0ABS1P3H9_9ACTN|nr:MULTISPECIES: hypothetical protein [Streptomyces]MBL1106627.1 hypothetical protein [Streptomyces musisoli]MBY8840577.1 hypothetical protein [Streptomyces sp. SP2-10]